MFRTRGPRDRPLRISCLRSENPKRMRSQCDDPPPDVEESRTVPKADPLQPERCAKLLASLATPERLRVVRFLAEGSHNVTEVAAMLDVPKANASHHLKVLADAGLIEGLKKGRFVWFTLRPGVLERVSQSNETVNSLNLGCCQFVMPPETSARRTTRA